MVLVRICDRIIGADEDVVVGSVEYTPDDGRDRGVSYDNGVALLLSILVAAYLVYALIAPEKL